MNALYRDLKKLIKKAEKENSEENSDNSRLTFHLMPCTGWLNDPNGLCCYKGEYHVFFQYSPFDAEGGLKVWGHYKSSDLINWTYLGVPIIPDQPYDCHGIYSGSALEKDGKLFLFYTGNVKLQGDYNYITDGRRSDTILAEYEAEKETVKKTVVLTNEDYPDDYTCHIRDPKVFYEDNKYFMVLGARDKNDQGKVLLYEGEGLKSWKLKNIFQSEDKFGYMWECPDLFTLNRKRILSVSPQGLEKAEYQFQNVYQSGYFIMYGDFTGAYRLSQFKEWDYGFDFYAPQTFEDEKGRRILIGWMGMPDETGYFNPTVKKGWQHALTVPRVLRAVGEVVYQNPVKEIEDLRIEEKILNLNKSESLWKTFELLLELKEDRDCRIEIDGGLELKYSKTHQVFSMEFQTKLGAGRKLRKAKCGSLSNIRILIDTSSIEIFLNNGELVFSSRWYPEEMKHSVIIVTENALAKAYQLGGFHIN